MFRSLFGTAVAGEDESDGAAVGGGGKAQGSHAARKSGAAQPVSSPSTKDSGGFFQLEPTNAPGGEERLGGVGDRLAARILPRRAFEQVVQSRNKLRAVLLCLCWNFRIPVYCTMEGSAHVGCSSTRRARVY